MRQSLFGTALLSAWMLLPATHALIGQTPAASAAPGGVPAALELRQIHAASSPIRVDGMLDEAPWQSATRYELAYEVYPGKNSASPVRTEAWVTYDQSNLFVAFHAYDPRPGEVRAHYSDRDSSSLFNDDRVGFLINPSNDGRRGFSFFINPLGVQADCLQDDVSGNRSCSDFDALWESAGRLTGDGYTVEVRVPFNSLRFQRGTAAQTWGFMPVRSYPRSTRALLWPVPKDLNASCQVCQYPKLAGFVGLTPGLNLELDPTFTLHRTDSRTNFPAGQLRHGPARGETGLSARWGITPNLSLSGAYNPDFSQVEADSPQLSINSRFALFYDEKRPFFLEGGDFFDTPISAVYTRTLAAPDWGVKLTGKEGGNGVGILVARDSLTNLLFPASQYSDLTSLDHPSTTAIVRFRRDLGASSTLGLLIADREGRDYFNRVYGLDGTVRITPSDVLRFQGLRSLTQYPDLVAAAYAQPAGRFSGSALSFFYAHDSRAWGAWAGIEDLGREFRADTGFIPQVDSRSANAGLKYTFWNPPGSRFSFWYMELFGDHAEDHSGLLLEESAGLSAGFSGPRLSGLNLVLSRGREQYQGIVYSQWRENLNFNIRPSGNFSFRLNGRFGDQIDYANGRPGKIIRLTTASSFNFGTHLSLTLDHTREQLAVSGGRLYLANLSNLRLACQFTLRAFVRLTLNYSDQQRDPALYLFRVNPRRRSLQTQALFSYKINPLTLLLAGYNDGRSQNPDTPLTVTQRTFFLKFGYAWVK